jgi:FkbM family methyltransferase
MKTTHKIAAARTIYHAVHAGRALLGRTDRQIVTRDGITYDLDLSQGIDFAIYLANIYERQTRAALRRLVAPGSLVLDIGANIGAHTLSLASLVGPAGRVLAFEPTDYAFRKLSRNLELNPDLAARVTAFHCFLTGADAEPVPSSIYSSWPLAREEGLHAKHLGREMRTEAARARSVDSVLAEHPGRTVQLVKLDVLCHGACALCAGGTRRLAERDALIFRAERVRFFRRTDRQAAAVNGARLAGDDRRWRRYQCDCTADVRRIFVCG